MKELVIISGKGGTGKTSITAAFAAIAQNAVLADCDVDAADLHLILEPQIEKTTNFSGGKSASVISSKCIGCGRCEEICKFEAPIFAGPANDIVGKTYLIDPISCEGCGVCVHFCPVDAIDFKDSINGQWFKSTTRFGPMVHAELGIAEENSGKLVSLIRKEAKKIAVEKNLDLIIVDGSPGIGCPVIASIGGADLALVVTEPTISGKHDMNRVLNLTSHFGVKTAVCVNKFDINEELTAEIEKEAKSKGAEIVGRIGYDDVVTEAQLEAKTVIEMDDNPVKKQVVSIWQKLFDILHKESESNEKY